MASAICDDHFHLTNSLWRRAMMHDKNVYSDPFEFKPERFLDENGEPDMSAPQPDTAFFGFGRRYVDLLSKYNLFMFNSLLIRVSAFVPVDIWRPIWHSLR